MHPEGNVIEPAETISKGINRRPNENLEEDVAYNWKDEEIRALINIWEEFIPELKKHKKNGAFFREMAVRLQEKLHREIPYTKQQVQNKVCSLKRQYEYNRKKFVDSIQTSRWRFYQRLDRILRTFHRRGKLLKGQEVLIKEEPSVLIPEVQLRLEDDPLQSEGGSYPVSPLNMSASDNKTLNWNSNNNACPRGAVQTSQEDSRTEDEYDALGKIVAAKLRRANSQQKIFAERIIHEVLYRVQMEKLDENSVLR